MIPHCITLIYVNCLKENYTDDKYFILCTEVIIEHIFIGFIQNMIVFIKKSNKIDFPQHAIIEHRAMCRGDSKVSTVISYPLEKCVYDVTVLALLSHWHIRHMAQCLIITW